MRAFLPLPVYHWQWRQGDLFLSVGQPGFPWWASWGVQARAVAPVVEARVYEPPHRVGASSLAGAVVRLASIDLR